MLLLNTLIVGSKSFISMNLGWLFPLWLGKWKMNGAHKNFFIPSLSLSPNFCYSLGIVSAVTEGGLENRRQKRDIDHRSFGRSLWRSDEARMERENNHKEIMLGRDQ